MWKYIVLSHYSFVPKKMFRRINGFEGEIWSGCRRFLHLMQCVWESAHALALKCNVNRLILHVASQPDILFPFHFLFFCNYKYLLEPGLSLAWAHRKRWWRKDRPLSTRYIFNNSFLFLVFLRPFHPSSFGHPFSQTHRARKSKVERRYGLQFQFRYPVR